MNRKVAITAAIGLIAVVLLSIFLVGDLFSSQTPQREFYVGIEYGYGDQVGELKSLVDKVKGYTNLMVLGVYLTYNRTLLDESCDYVADSGLNFIVLFTSRTEYKWTEGYRITDWMADAQQKYGDKFLGIYKIDEPGGNQLDLTASALINDTSSYSQTAEYYVGNLSQMINYYHPYTPGVFTADYALEWFDYKANYTGIFAEFVGNESRQRIIAQNRGAATAFNRDWGIIINWKYNQAPYLESGTELYDDLALAYSSGAKYAFIFSHPNFTDYGIMADEHFDALEKFWWTIHSDPDSLGANEAQVAYVVPRDYGFGFRNAEDRIWGLFPTDAQSAKIYHDVEALTAQYGAGLDILYDEPETITPILQKYSEVFYWNQTTITSVFSGE